MDKSLVPMVTITEQYLKFLQKREAELTKLEEAGVDNWVGYGMAFENDEEE